MSLNNPDSRRGLRSIIEAVVAIVLLVLVWRITGYVKGIPAALLPIARGALLIIGIGTFMYGAENVTRAVKISTPFGSAEVGDDDADKPSGS